MICGYALGTYDTQKKRETIAKTHRCKKIVIKSKNPTEVQYYIKLVIEWSVFVTLDLIIIYNSLRMVVLPVYMYIHDVS